MLYDSTKTLLRSTLQSLETVDETTWDDQIESIKACLYEMHQMSAPLFRAYKKDALNAHSPAHNPICDKLNRALPHVKSMLSAVRQKDRAAALESGKAALAVM